MKLGIILPTNNPQHMFEFFLPSLQHLSELSDIATILINFNGSAWDKKRIGLAIGQIGAAGFKSKYIIEPKDLSEAPLLRYRNDAAALAPQSDYYMFADDNLVFTIGTKAYPGNSALRYGEVLSYLEEFKNCGIVMCEGSLGGDIQKRQIRPSDNGLISTTRGLFFRNTTKGKSFYPEETLGLVSGMEESIIGFWLIEQGYFMAKQFNNPTQHKNKSKIFANVPKAGIHDIELLLDNAYRWIRERYCDSAWTHDSRRPPKGLYKMYAEAGGDSMAFKDYCSMCHGEIKSEKYWRNYKHL